MTTEVLGPQSNGNYWQASWTTPQGKRKRVSLGPKAALSKRAARGKVLQLQRKLDGNPAAGSGARGTLGGLRSVCDRRDESEGLAKGTRQLHADTWKRLLAHFGEGYRVERLTPASADEWSLEELGGVTETTRARYHRDARLFGSIAIREGWLAVNPFEHLRKTAPKIGNDRAWAGITAEHVANLVAAANAASPEWGNLVALCAYAGLRRGEALALRGSDVLADRLVVRSVKTARQGGAAERYPWVCPELRAQLGESVAEGYLCPRNHATSHYHRKMAGWERPNGTTEQGFMQLAGLAWGKPYHTLRKWRRMTWEQRFPMPVVDAWLGHSAAVAREHYTAVPEHLYQGDG